MQSWLAVLVSTLTAACGKASGAAATASPGTASRGMAAAPVIGSEGVGTGSGFRRLLRRRNDPEHLREQLRTRRVAHADDLLRQRLAIRGEALLADRFDLQVGRVLVQRVLRAEQRLGDDAVGLHDNVALLEQHALDRMRLVGRLSERPALEPVVHPTVGGGRRVVAVLARP